jgi:zinc protease
MTDSDSGILPFEATEVTMDNGLRLIVVPTGIPNLVSLQIPVQTGSRNEVEPGKSGFAHFFEHMMFRGTPRFSTERYNGVITRAGARQNAYTTDDYTNYHITCAAEDLETILELEADRFMNLAYSEEDFRTEASAILGEYNKSASDPLNKLIEVQRDHAFSTHTYKHTTMGFIRDIENMPSQFEYSRTFFDRWYRPEFTTIIVAGDVQPDAVVNLVYRYWRDWRPGAAATTIIPQEPPAIVPTVVHVPWPAPSLPWVTIGFRGPAFREDDQSYAALDTLFDLSFGETSDLYHQLVEVEQKVDQFFGHNPLTQDPSLATILARLKDPADAEYVREQILRTVANLRSTLVDTKRLADAKSHARYSFARTLDNSESVAATLARFVRFNRSYETLNVLFRQYERLSPSLLLEVAQKYLRPDVLVQATLSHEPLAPALGTLPQMDSPVPSAPGRRDDAAISRGQLVVQRTPSTLLRLKLLFAAGSAHDPAGKEGLAALSAEMIAGGGSTEMRFEEITRALFPIAGSFNVQVDREMTVFTGVTHNDNLDAFLTIVLPQLLSPGYRDEDFSRVKEQQKNALVQDLRSNNDEELGKERLQANVFAGSAYGHPTLGTAAGIEAIELIDVKEFAARAFTAGNLTIGLSGAFPAGMEERIGAELASLPAGGWLPAPSVEGRKPAGVEIEIVSKDTRAVAISFGHPISVTRSHPDYAALWLARAFLGDHRSSVGRLQNRIRELRGMNYGNYAYTEAFPRGMYQFFPDPNLGRKAQLFEVWIRPVPPEQAVFALKAGLFEVGKLVRDGVSEDEFEEVRDYLRKNVFVMLKTQDQQLGYALDSHWYGIGDFAATMREQLDGLTAEAVNAAIRRHLSAENVSVVVIAPDAARLTDELLSGAPATISYNAPKAQEVLDEDKLIGALDLRLTAQSIRITDVESVFAR